jgi:hypothetical protein
MKVETSGGGDYRPRVWWKRLVIAAGVVLVVAVIVLPRACAR